MAMTFPLRSNIAAHQPTRLVNAFTQKVVAPFIRSIPNEGRRVAAARRVSRLSMTGKVLVRQNGSLVLLDLENLIDRYAFLQRGWENRGVGELLEMARSFGSSTFLDVGAGFGTYTLAMANLSTISAIDSFEPDPVNRAQLHANLWLNGLTERVRVHDAAISDREGQARFYLARKPDYWERPLVNYGTSALDFLRIRHRTQDAIDIRTVALDKLNLPIGTDIAIKLDVEGNEGRALEGATKTIQTARSVVLMIEIFARSKDKVAPILKSLGLMEARQVSRENYIYVRQAPTL